MYGKILIPTDGSGCSTEAIRHGLAFAKDRNGEITFLYVLEPLPSAITSYSYTTYNKQILENLKTSAEGVLADALAMAEEAGVTAKTKLVQWVRPADAVAAVMKDFDLVIMGSHGRSGVRRLLLGSVTEEVMRQALRPVLVVRCSERD